MELDHWLKSRTVSLRMAGGVRVVGVSAWIAFRGEEHEAVAAKSFLSFSLQLFIRFNDAVLR